MTIADFSVLRLERGGIYLIEVATGTLSEADIADLQRLMYLHQIQGILVQSPTGHAISVSNAAVPHVN